MPSLDSVLCRIVEKLEALDGQQPKVIKIDGCPGSGKSTLATALGKAIDGQVVKASDFIGTINGKPSPEERFKELYQWDELEKKVLQPGKAGKHLQFTPRDSEGKNTEKIVQLCLPKKFILLEGNFLGNPQLNHLFDYSIYINADQDLRKRRLQDQGKGESPFYQDLIKLEQWYLENIKPEDNADFVYGSL